MDYTPADAVIDLAEIHVFDTPQQLPEWQRQLIQRIFREDRPALG